jgi:hypothetical protein
MYVGIGLYAAKTDLCNLGAWPLFGGYIMDDDDRIATCQICTIAPALRVCKACAFNIGLAFRVVKEQETLNADCVLRIEELRVILVDAMKIANIS